MTYDYDPELLPHIDRLPSIDLSNLAGTRAARIEQARGLAPITLADVRHEDIAVPGLDGAPDVRVRVYRPAAGDRLPAICFMHAGGWCLGSVDEAHARAAQLCQELQALVVSVDYRLAPEHPYPAALDDCYAVLTWLAQRSAELRIDRHRIAVHGISSGANLAAALALLARDRAGPGICFQCLCYPPLDDRLQTTSARRFTDTVGITTPFLRECWSRYLGAAFGTDDVSVYAAPLRARDLSSLPPAYISVLQYDPLRDEGIAYTDALLAAQVQVELHLFPGTFHGSQKLAQAAISRRELEEVVVVLRRALAAPSGAAVR